MAQRGEVCNILVVLRFLGPTPTAFAADSRVVSDFWSNGPHQDLPDVCYIELWFDVFRLAQDIGLERLSMIEVNHT
eukprot:1624420-Pyramimonas_sp.AAC.1